jgi:hypothetical protein
VGGRREPVRARVRTVSLGRPARLSRLDARAAGDARAQRGSRRTRSQQRKSFVSLLREKCGSPG